MIRSQQTGKGEGRNPLRYLVPLTCVFFGGTLLPYTTWRWTGETDPRSKSRKETGDCQLKEQSDRSLGVSVAEMWHDKFLRLHQYHEYLWPISPKTSVGHGQRIHQRFLLGNCSVLLGNEPWMTKLRAIKWRVCASVLHALRGGKIIKRLYSEEVNFFWKKLLFLLVDELDYLSKCGVGDMQAFVGTDFQGPPLRLLFGNDKPESLQTKRLCLPLSWSVKGQPLLRSWGNV